MNETWKNVINTINKWTNEHTELTYCIARCLTLLHLVLYYISSFRSCIVLLSYYVPVVEGMMRCRTYLITYIYIYTHSLVCVFDQQDLCAYIHTHTHTYTLYYTPWHHEAARRGGCFDQGRHVVEESESCCIAPYNTAAAARFGGGSVVVVGGDDDVVVGVEMDSIGVDGGCGVGVVVGVGVVGVDDGLGSGVVVGGSMCVYVFVGSGVGSGVGIGIGVGVGGVCCAATGVGGTGVDVFSMR